MLEPIWSCGGILPTALVDILESTASEDNGDDDEAGEEDVMFPHVIHVVTRQDHKNTSR